MNTYHYGPDEQELMELQEMMEDADYQQWAATVHHEEEYYMTEAYDAREEYEGY